MMPQAAAMSLGLGTWLPTVVLWHDQPAGGHYDWLIARPAIRRGCDPDAPLLQAWRVPLPPHRWPRPGQLPIGPLPDHRARYLTHTGPLPPAGTLLPDRRGTLRPVAHGQAMPQRVTDPTWHGLIRWPTPDGWHTMSARVADQQLDLRH